MVLICTKVYCSSNIIVCNNFWMLKSEFEPFKKPCVSKGQWIFFRIFRWHFTPHNIVLIYEKLNIEVTFLLKIWFQLASDHEHADWLAFNHLVMIYLTFNWSVSGARESEVLAKYDCKNINDCLFFLRFDITNFQAVLLYHRVETES